MTASDKTATHKTHEHACKGCGRVRKCSGTFCQIMDNDLCNDCAGARIIQYNAESFRKVGGAEDR